MSRTKKVKSAGRFGAGIGTYARNRLNAVESLQRKKQTCPKCAKPGIKRVATGIWECSRCGAQLAAHAYLMQNS
jgi:large subunit ribosomal protein L37Ae